ncbi:MAG TPA: hypothetical protein VMD30_08305 [Tepidisphaeraceae bacterium]|nr:hypothetical protein [Tepidisphaeraceae bacterium]
MRRDYFGSLALTIVLGCAQMAFNGIARASTDDSPSSVTSTPDDSHVPVEDPTNPAGAAADADTVAKLAQVTRSIRFTNAPLTQAIDSLRDATRLNIVVDWGALRAAGIDPTGQVDFQLQNVSYDRVLQTMLQLSGANSQLDYEIRDGIVFISTADSLEQRPVTRVFDIKDLLEPPMPASGQAGPTGPADNLIKVLESVVAPDSWRDSGGTVGACQCTHGELVVLQTPRNQRQVAHFLDQLRHPIPAD